MTYGLLHHKYIISAILVFFFFFFVLRLIFFLESRSSQQLNFGRSKHSLKLKSSSNGSVHLLHSSAPVQKRVGYYGVKKSGKVIINVHTTDLIRALLNKAKKLKTQYTASQQSSIGLFRKTALRGKTQAPVVIEVSGSILVDSASRARLMLQSVSVSTSEPPTLEFCPRPLF